MNTFNRFLLIILALGSALFWMAAVLSIWVFPRELAEIFRSFSTMLRLQPSVLQGLITALGVSAGAVSLLVLVGELFPQEPTMVTVDNVHGGTAAVTIAALMLGLKQQLEERTGLQAVRPTVTSHHNGLDVHVEMHADSGYAACPQCGEYNASGPDSGGRAVGTEATQRAGDLYPAYLPGQAAPKQRQQPEQRVWEQYHRAQPRQRSGPDVINPKNFCAA